MTPEAGLTPLGLVGGSAAPPVREVVRLVLQAAPMRCLAVRGVAVTQAPRRDQRAGLDRALAAGRQTLGARLGFRAAR